MKYRHLVIFVVAFALGFIALRIFTFSDREKQQTMAALEDVLEQRVVNGQDVMAVTKSDQRMAQQIADQRAPANPETLKALREIWQKVDQLEMFDNAALDPYRDQVKQWAAKDEAGFEQFVVEKMASVENQRIETTFFFLETYVSSNSDPGQVISQWLKQSSPANDGEDSAKTNLMKGFALENLFERHSQGPPFAVDPLPKVEAELVRIVKEDSDLNLAREAILLLQSYYDYSKDQLRSFVNGRPERDNYAFDDILN